MISKRAVLMFIQRSQTPQINKCIVNTGNVNVYRNIGNVFKNHITVIEKKYIVIHIDIELCPALHPGSKIILTLSTTR